ncbi:MAG: OadG family protein [Bacteroidales bacterium]|nr:OadG family protein [Bacteroidales bacterium]MBR6250227.1 OadG family protein [Bacteroidales bacterium]MCR5696047.1 OadG family protein [Marinilabiliaceae bacterium]
MESNILEALELMVVGLSTVFLVLLLVICAGNLLIRFVNRFVPEEDSAKASQGSAQTVDPNVAQAIKLAIQKISGNKSTAEKIEKI